MQCQADFRERQKLFVLECARHLKDDPDTGAEYCGLLWQERKTIYMMANFSIRAFRLLKPAFFVLIATLLWNTLAMSPASSQTSQTQTNARKLKVSVPPEYPELARKMNIQGVARVLLTVTTDGRVVGVKELGGNPVLVAFSGSGRSQMEV